MDIKAEVAAIELALNTEFDDMTHYWSGDVHIVGLDTEQPRVWAEFTSQDSQSYTCWVTIDGGTVATAEELEEMEEYHA